jgi:hypothetical protein
MDSGELWISLPTQNRERSERLTRAGIRFFRTSRHNSASLPIWVGPALQWPDLTVLRWTAVEKKVSDRFRLGVFDLLAAVKLSLGLTSSGDVVSDIFHKVLVAIADHYVVD